MENITQDVNIKSIDMSITQDVNVRNIHMDFWTLVGFLVKLSFAIIPALIIITIISAILFAVFTGMVSSLR
tara:strand:- start:4537 stop:4749 length:213 start_codon:yes stop_codon:yes gene_type:complete